MLAFNVNSARSPSDVYSWSVAGGKNETARWTTSETGGIPATRFVEPELVRWKSFDGREITGFLYKPDAAKFPGPRPVIINIHGGPEGQFRPGFAGRNNYFINELGCAILFPNVRGSSGYGKTFLQLDNGLKREDSYKDISALLDWLPSRRELDKDRVMVTGGSYGGFMTLQVAWNYADRIRCALDVVGISNLATFLKNTESYRRDLRRVEYGDERDPQQAEFMERIAATNNAQQDHEADVRGARRERSARAENRGDPDRRHAQETRHAGLVPDGERRRPRLREKEERGLPVLRDDEIHRGASPRRTDDGEAGAVASRGVAPLLVIPRQAKRADATSSYEANGETSLEV